MYTVTLRFYEELNDFLPRERRRVDFTVTFPGKRTVKDLVESLDVPHTEVDLILANGISVDFNYIVRDADRISVYPVFESLDIGPVTRLRPVPLRDPRFVLDVHLRRLARYLRMLGFDADWAEGRDDPLLARIARDEKRILLTRDRGLLKRKSVDRGIYIHSTVPEEQAAEVIRRLDCVSSVRPLTRCLECNGMIGENPCRTAPPGVPPGVSSWCGEYFICGECGRVYWHGSHTDRMKERIARILAMAGNKREENQDNG